MTNLVSALFHLRLGQFLVRTFVLCFILYLGASLVYGMNLIVRNEEFDIWFLPGYVINRIIELGGLAFYATGYIGSGWRPLLFWGPKI